MAVTEQPTAAWPTCEDTEAAFSLLSEALNAVAKLQEKYKQLLLAEDAPRPTFTDVGVLTLALEVIDIERDSLNQAEGDLRRVVDAFVFEVEGRSDRTCARGRKP